MQYHSHNQSLPQGKIEKNAKPPPRQAIIKFSALARKQFHRVGLYHTDHQQSRKGDDSDRN
jgi:hypothetical protein